MNLSLDGYGGQAPTHPPLPPPDEREGGAVQPDPGHSMGLRRDLPVRPGPNRCLRHLAPPLQPPPTPHRHRRRRPPQTAFTTSRGSTAVGARSSHVTPSDGADQLASRPDRGLELLAFVLFRDGTLMPSTAPERRTTEAFDIQDYGVRRPLQWQAAPAVAGTRWYPS